MAVMTPEQKREQEKATVGLMIELYCRGNHGTPKGQLCPGCAAGPLPAYGHQDFLQRLQNALLQARDAGAHPSGHALERPADAVPPPRAGGAAPGGDAEAEEGAISKVHEPEGERCLFRLFCCSWSFPSQFVQNCTISVSNNYPLFTNLFG